MNPSQAEDDAPALQREGFLPRIRLSVALKDRDMNL